MKKSYETPSLEVVKFQYRDQVVAASGEACTNQMTNEGPDTCENWEHVKNYLG